MQQLKLEQLSEKEELEKEMTEKVGVKDEALAKLKEQLIANQNILDATVNKHLIELKESIRDFNSSEKGCRNRRKTCCNNN